MSEAKAATPTPSELNSPLPTPRSGPTFPAPYVRVEVGELNPADAELLAEIRRTPPPEQERDWLRARLNGVLEHCEAARDSFQLTILRPAKDWRGRNACTDELGGCVKLVMVDPAIVPLKIAWPAGVEAETFPTRAAALRWIGDVEGWAQELLARLASPPASGTADNAPPPHRPNNPPIEFLPGQFRLEGGVWHDLSGKPWEVLKSLAEAPGYTLTRGELLKRIWPDSSIEPSTVGNHISDARNALRGAGATAADPILNLDRGELAAWRLDLSGSPAVPAKATVSRQGGPKSRRTQPSKSHRRRQQLS